MLLFNACGNSLNPGRQNSCPHTGLFFGRVGTPVSRGCLCEGRPQETVGREATPVSGDLDDWRQGRSAASVVRPLAVV